VGRDYRPVDHAATGTVIVLFQAGWAPRLSEVSIDLPIAGELFTMAFPIYRDFGSPQPSLRIRADGAEGASSRIVDVRTLAIKALQERMPGILSRGALGALAKIEAQKKAHKEYGPLGGLVAGMLSKAVTSADLRSWLSLPAEVQAARVVLQPGARELVLSAYDWTERVPVNVSPGSTTFLSVRGLPGYKTFNLSTLKPES
jgi:hypothetical protein